MLSKKDVLKRLESLPDPNPNQATTPYGPELKDFLWCLLRGDQHIFFIRTADSKLWQYDGDNDSTYIPAFSHKDLAEEYSKKHADNASVIDVGFPDWLALIRRAFFSGAVISYNESETRYCFAPWDILVLVNEYFKKKSCELYAVDPDVERYRTFIQKVRNNASYQLCCISGSKTSIAPLLDNNKPYYRVCERSDESYNHPLTLSSMFFFFGAIRVSISNEEYELDSEKLKQVLRLSGVSPPKTAYIPAVLCANEPSPKISSVVKDLCLDITFDAAVDDPDDDCSLPATPTPEPEQRSESSTDDDVTFVIDEPEPKTNEPVIDVTKSQPFYREEKKKKIQQIYPSDDPKRAKKRLLLYALIPFFAVCLLLLFVLGSQIKAEKYAHFASYLREEKYEPALDMYQAAGNTKRYDEQLGFAVEAVVSDYASGKIDENKAGERLDGISAFPKTDSAIDAAVDRIAAISVSRSHFSAGAKTEDMGERIIYWSYVIPEDTESYPAVASFVNEKTSEGVRYVIDKLEQGTPAEQETLIQLADRACVLFPDHADEIVSARDRYLARCEAYKAVPITISSLSLLHEDNSLTLLIRWKNQSDRVIRQVDFQFEFLDASGNIVLQTDMDGHINQTFVGRELAGPYAPGYETPETPLHGWQGVWSGAGDKVSTVRVTRVDVRLDGEDAVLSFSGSDLPFSDTLWY